MLKELILHNRSYRRFYQDEAISRDTLCELVDLARLAPSAANLQPLKYMLSHEPQSNRRIFPCLRWAGYLKDWGGPEEGERPAAYILLLGDTRIAPAFHCDHGIAAQSILLGAVERGLGGCMIANVDSDRLRRDFSIPEYLQILLLIALGKPKEKVVLEPLPSDGNIRYYRDAESIHRVPKRSLDDLVLPLGETSSL